ncbi:Alpha/Beta hydrolase protein [Chytriomyces sp. MP71]|nr:Alpha/Beta hydrolase protein [Chytriomyces sp. MP71]
MKTDEAHGFFKGEWVSHGAAQTSERVVLYIHGGAFLFCSRKTHRGITWKIAKSAKCRVLSIDYRLSPEFEFPLALHDAISAYSFLVNTKTSDSQPFSPRKVIIAGDSAGGNLTIALILWLRDNGLKHGLPMPAGAATLSPWVDLTHSMPSFKLNAKYDYLPEKMKGKLISSSREQYYVSDNNLLKHPLVSPLFARESPGNPICPLLIQCGEVERLRDEILAFATRSFPSSPIHLELYDAMVHVFHMFNAVDALADFALERIGAFVQIVSAPDFDPSRFGRTFVRVNNVHQSGFPISELELPEINAYLDTKYDA